MLRNHVLFLVDDDADDQEIFRSALANIDSTHILMTANNGQDALAYLHQCRQKPDFIFVDLNMPRMSGLQVLKEIKKIDALRNVPVFIYSTSANPRDIAKASESGAERFITKPARFTDLCNVLQTLLTGEVIKG